LAPSYESFLALANGIPVDWSAKRFDGSRVEAGALLEAAAKLASAPVDLVTIDMPMATVPITQRRTADNLISKAFGARGCSTHSPGKRPGKLGNDLTRQFKESGFEVATATVPVGTRGRLVEVYPHPALLSLLHREERVKYKVAKSSQYHAGKSRPERITLLLKEFENIVNALAPIIGPVPLPLPQLRM